MGSHQDDPAATEKPAAHPRAVLAIALGAYFMIILDTSVAFTVIPKMRASLSLSATELAWVQGAYALTFGGLMLLAARAGDLLGRRRVLSFGLVLFSVAALSVGSSQNGTWLVASRAVQGVGAAIVAPSSLSLLTSHFSGVAKARAIAWHGAMAGVGTSLGMVISGAVTEFISWRAGFFIHLPVALVMLFASRRFLVQTAQTRGRFDVAGAVLATSGASALVYGILSSVRHGWTSPVTTASLATSLVLIVLLVINEAKAPQPIMPLRLFASAERSGALAVRVFFLCGMVGFYYFTSQFLQDALGWTALKAGAGYLPMTIVNFSVALSVPRLAKFLGSATLIVLGLTAAAIGLFWLGHLHADASYWAEVAPPMVLLGIGQGLAISSMNASGLAEIEPSDAGAASGVLNMAHQIGGAIGLAILVAIASGHNSGSPGSRERVAAHVSAAMTAGAALILVAVVVALATVVPGQVRRRTP